MVTTFLFPLLAFLYGLRRKWGRDRFEHFLNALLAALFGLGIAWGIACFIVTMAPGRPMEFEKTDLIALSTSASVEGQFFLGSGRIEGQSYYFFYYSTPDGGKKLGKLSAEEVTLYEEDRAGAFMAKVKTEKEHSSKGWTRFFVTESQWDLRWSNDVSYAIHVPKGSVREEIRLDLPR